MPLPRPKDDESKKDFLARCMGDPVMVEEYDDEAQRYAVCLNLWKEDKKSMGTTFESRSAIGVHHTDTSTGDWDGPGNEARLKNDGDEAYYRKAYAWQDPDEDPNTKAAYKFIHHEVDSEGNIGPANLRACSSGIGILNGGRGGADIPDSDRPGVYRHLAAHIKDAGEEAPELRDKQRVVEVEYRFQPLTTGLEVRVAEGAASPTISGYCPVYSAWSLDLGGFRERVLPGACTKTIQRTDILSTFNHNPDYPLGRVEAGTLELREDDKGVVYTAKPADTSYVRDLVANIRAGNVAGNSFAFRTIEDRWYTQDGQTCRDLIEIEIDELGPVTCPAYPASTVSVRSLFTNQGVDYDALAEAIRKHQRGLALTSEDRDLIQASIDVLSRYLPAENAQGSGKDAPPAQGSRLAILRKRLEIAEKALV